jgi:hypothetical protein
MDVHGSDANEVDEKKVCICMIFGMAMEFDASDACSLCPYNVEATLANLLHTVHHYGSFAKCFVSHRLFFLLF